MLRGHEELGVLWTFIVIGGLVTFVTCNREDVATGVDDDHVVGGLDVAQFGVFCWLDVRVVSVSDDPMRL